MITEGSKLKELVRKEELCICVCAKLKFNCIKWQNILWG